MVDWKDSSGSKKMYYCRICGHDHRRSSKIGKEHIKIHKSKKHNLK